jgi:hypothetical protein
MNDFSPAHYDLLSFDLPFFGMASSAYEGWIETALFRAADAQRAPEGAETLPRFPLSARTAQEPTHE